ncbi:MAG: diguanylate cyclase [Lachnospiraceae bacterium]|nr:diguanylate cyclase [Lachnospiraceae bacterium]
MKNSLKNKFILITILSFTVLMMVVGAVGYTTVYKLVSEQEEEDMRKIVKMTMAEYDRIYPGEYGIQLNEDGTYIVYKGEEDISDDYVLLDSVKDNFEYDISLFCKNIRVLTTFEDENGDRLKTTKAATTVDQDVIDGAKAHFYSNVKIGDQSCFAYYEPIFLKDGTVYGMIGVCCPATTVHDGVIRAVSPLAVICAITAIFFCIISISFSKAIIKRFTALSKFMRSVANGNFMTPVDPVLNSDDELGEVCKDARRMQRNIQVLVEIDTLTKLNNRRYGGNRLKVVMKKAEESGMPFCVCIGDIDFFKKVNDTYGHDAGDEVLKAVASVLNANMKGKGFVARWGGEEFLIVYEMADLKPSVDALNDMLQEVRELEIVSGGITIKVTMSFGIIQGQGGWTEDMLLKAADDNLYYAKTHGRNQVYYGQSES